MISDLKKKLKNDIKIALKAAGIKLWEIRSKFTMWYISVKKDDGAL